MTSKSEITRGRIMQAAERVFSRYGYEGARLDDIARKAKLEQPHLYYYFKGKQQLYKAVLESLTHEIAVELDAFLSRPPMEMEQKLDALIDLLFDFIDRHRALLGVAFSELVHPPRTGKGGAVFVRVAEKLEKLLLAALKAITKDTDTAAHLLLSLEGVVLLPFLLDDSRVQSIIGTGKYQSLAARKAHVKKHVRALIGIYSKQ